MNAPAELALNRRPPLRDFGLWLGAGMVVLIAHAAFAYLLRDIAPLPQHDAEEAMVIDLAPLPISVPETVQSEILPQDEPVERVQPVEDSAETVEPQPDEVVEEQPETVEESPPEPEREQPVTETVQPEPDKAEVAEPDIAEQETIEAVTPEVAVPLPQPRPERQAEKKPERPEKKPPPRKRETVKQKTRETVDPPKRQASKDEGKERRKPPASQASTASRAPQVDPSRWNSAVRSAIARRAGSVRGMRGTVRVSFVVSSSGSIVSAGVSGSSGNARLDQAALRMVRSARVPAPPAGLGGSRHSFAIPLTFR